MTSAAPRPSAAEDDAASWGRRSRWRSAAGGSAPPIPWWAPSSSATGELVGEGFHARAGAAHAEVEALRDAGERARGATLYVTLEPCNHQGRTPPCVDAILRAGIRRVVVAVADPNPTRAGRGRAGASRRRGRGATSDASRRKREPAIGCSSSRWSAGEPHVTLKCAMTLDGKIAAFDRSARWITGEEARREAHRLRSQNDAVMVGIGTVLADDPAPDRAARPAVAARAAGASWWTVGHGFRSTRGSSARGRRAASSWRWRTRRPPTRVAALEALGRDRAGLQEPGRSGRPRRPPRRGCSRSM